MSQKFSGAQLFCPSSRESAIIDDMDATDHDARLTIALAQKAKPTRREGAISGPEAARVCLFFALLLLCVLLSSCAAEEKSASGRVLVIAVDGASTRLIDELMDEGHLPHLAAIAEAGARGVARPTPPLLSPRIWTSVVTGKKPEQHGIEGWVWLDSKKAPHLYSSRDRKAHALWNILGANGRSTGVVNWLMTHPPEKIKGIIVSDHAGVGMMADKLKLAKAFAANKEGAKGEVQIDAATASFVYPASFGDRLEHARNAPPLTSVPDPFGDSKFWADRPVTAFLSQVYENDQFAARLALEIEAEIAPDLLLVYLPGIDRVSHFIWDSVEALSAIPEKLRRPAAARAKLALALRSYYEYVDQLIGRLQKGRSPDDLVMVLSDHGFEINPESAELGGVHDSPAARDGILFVRGRGIEAGGRGLVMNMTDITPTILAWLDIPIAEDMSGKPAAFAQRDNSRSIPSYDTSEIEFLGIEVPEVESRIIDNLKELGYVED